MHIAYVCIVCLFFQDWIGVCVEEPSGAEKKAPKDIEINVSLLCFLG